MYKDNNFQNGKKKIEVLRDKIPALKRTNKPDEVFQKQKQLFHLCISFSYILFIKKNSVDFNKFINYASQTLSSMVQKRHSKFSVNWKKQITYFLLCSLVFYRSNSQKKFSLTCLHEAQRICSNLTCEEPRHYDYVLATNTFTAFTLIKIGQVEEALDFLNIAEKVLKKIIDYSVTGKLTEKQQKWHDMAQEMHASASDKSQSSPPQKRQVKENGGEEIVNLTSQNSQPTVESIPEVDEERPLAKIKIKKKNRNVEDQIFKALGPCPELKPSRLTIAQIQNYMLSISIMKTIALKHANIIVRNIDDEEFEIKFGQQIEWLVELDNQISQVNNGRSEQDNFSEINISYLVAQHYKEMVEGSYDIKGIIRQSFDPAFVAMLCGSMFEPLLSKDTPDKSLVPPMTKREVANAQDEKYAFNPDSNEIQSILEARSKLVQTIMSEASAKRALIRQAQERHQLVQEQIDKKNALLQKNRPESGNRFFNASANFVPIDVARAGKEFSGAGSVALSGTGSVRSGQDGGSLPVAHINVYGPTAAEKMMSQTIPSIPTPQNEKPFLPGYRQGSYNVPVQLSPTEREIQRILQSQQSPKAGYAGPFVTSGVRDVQTPQKSIIKNEYGRNTNESRHGSTNTNRRVQIVESLPVDRDVIGNTFEKSPIKQTDYANEPVLVDELVPKPIIRKERVRTSPHGPLSIRQSPRTYNRDKDGPEDERNTVELKTRDISADREKEIENQIQQILIEKEGSQAAKSRGGPISPLDEIKENDYDLVPKKIKSVSKTREEARPRKRDFSRPEGVPKLNLNALKNESAPPKTSGKGSVVDSGKTSEKRVNFSQKQPRPFVRGLAKLATKTQYNESKRSPRAMLLQNKNKFPFNDNRDISVYSGAQKQTPKRGKDERKDSEGDHNSSIEQFNNSYKQSAKNQSAIRTGSRQLSQPRNYSRPSNHRVIQNVYLKGKDAIEADLFENSIIEQSPRLGQDQKKITDRAHLPIQISPREYIPPVSNQNYAAVKHAMEMNYQKLQKLQKQSQLRIKREFEEDLMRERAKRRSEQPRTSPKAFNFKTISIKENTDLIQTKEKSQGLPKRSPRQVNTQKKKSPKVAEQKQKDGQNTQGLQKDIFETSTRSLKSDNAQEEQKEKPRGEEVGIQVDEMRQNSANISNPSVNITIGMQTPLERSVDYIHDSESNVVTDIEQPTRHFDYAQHMANVKYQKLKVKRKNSNRLSPRQRQYEVYKVTRTKIETPADHAIRANNVYSSRNDEKSRISGIDSFQGSHYRNERPQRLPDVRGLGSQGGKPRHKVVSQRPKIEIPKKYKELSRAIHEQSLTDHSVVIENSQELPPAEESSIIVQSRIFDSSETANRNQQQSRTHQGPFYMHRSSAVESSPKSHLENEISSLQVNQDLPQRQSGVSETMTLNPKPSIDMTKKSKKATSPFKQTPTPFRIERRIPETQKMSELRSLSVKQPRVINAVEMAYKYNQRHSIFNQTKFGAQPLTSNRSTNRSKERVDKQNQPKIFKPLRLESLPNRNLSLDQRPHTQTRRLNLTKKDHQILQNSPQQHNINESLLMKERSETSENIDKIMKSLVKSEYTTLNMHPKMSVSKTLNHGGPHIDRYEHTKIVGKKKVDMSFAQSLSSNKSKVDYEKLMKGVPPPQNIFTQ